MTTEEQVRALAEIEQAYGRAVLTPPSVAPPAQPL
jgi:hypothetical protein